MAINLYSKASVDDLLAAKLSDAPVDGDTYGRKDGAWAVVSGGGGLTINDLSNGATSTLNATVPTAGQALTYDGTDLKWATISAPVTSVAGRTGAITLAVADVSGAAPTASPSLSGTPLAPTATADTNTTQIATTAYVVGQASSTTPAATGTAAVGTSLKYARADHVHANPLPTGGSTSQVLSKVDGTNYNVQWVTPSSGGSGGCDIQTFGSSTSSGSFTWTKPAGAKWVEIYLVGGGAGGSSGTRNATTSGRAGGGGGCGGTAFYGRVHASYFGSTQAVVVGAKGTGGASVTTNATAGTSGTAGTASTFGLFKSGFGTAPNGSSAGSVTASLFFATAVTSTGTAGAGATTDGNPGGTINAHCLVPAGGGGGGGAAASSTTSSIGGDGGRFATLTGTASLTSNIAGGTGADSFSTGGNGTSQTTNYFQAGTAGGAGGYGTNRAGSAGGNGGWPGGGGGGGGASDNGFASGKGGDGANGFALIITYF